jgi:FAD/FMN-containing dehydrogenase
MLYMPLQNFAVRRNLQVTVKGTGHDYNGRCSADGSLNINTRMLNDVFFDVPQNKVRWRVLP